MITIKFQWPTLGPLITIASDDTAGTRVLPAFVAPTATGAQLLKDIATGMRVLVSPPPPTPGVFATAAPYILPLLCAGDSPVRERPVQKNEPETPLPQRPVEWQQRRFADRPGHADLYRQLIERDRARMTETMMPERYRGDRTTIEDAPVVMPADTPPAIALPATAVPVVEDSAWEVAHPTALPYFERHGRDPEAPHPDHIAIPNGTAGMARDLMHDGAQVVPLDFLPAAIPKQGVPRPQKLPLQMGPQDGGALPQEVISDQVALPTLKDLRVLSRGGTTTTSQWTLMRLSDRVGFFSNPAGDKGFVVEPSEWRYDRELLFVPLHTARHVASALRGVQITLPVKGRTVLFVVSPIGHDVPVAIVRELELRLVGSIRIAGHIPWTQAYLEHLPTTYHPLHHSAFGPIAPEDWDGYRKLTPSEAHRVGDRLAALWVDRPRPPGPKETAHQYMTPFVIAALKDPHVSDDVKSILVILLINEGDQAFRYLTNLLRVNYTPAPGDDQLQLNNQMREDLELHVWALFRFFPSLHDPRLLFPQHRPGKQR